MTPTASLNRRIVSAALLGCALALVAIAPGRAMSQELEKNGGDVDVTRHGVFTFDCADSGFTPAEVTTDLGKSTIFIRNVTQHAQQYTITRKRVGKKKRVLFNGETVGGQAIMGNTKFRSGDVFVLTETNTGTTATITVR